MSGGDPQELTEQQKNLLTRARKGILQYLLEKGGTLPIPELHDYSMNKYFVQHQRFSQLIEKCVDEKLLQYNAAQQTLSLTESGRKSFEK